MSAPSIPSTQCAWVQTARGDPRKVIKLRKDVPVPSPKQDEILIEVLSTALNPVYYKLAKLLPTVFRGKPLILEGDLAGRVVEPNGHPFKVGDEVVAFSAVDEYVKGGKGGMAQYTVIKSDKLFKKPPSISLDEAAGIPIAGKTAYDCVIGLLQLDTAPPGTRVFINGGSTSVGAIAVQIAKHVCGVEVVTSCSGRNVEAVKGYGVDQVLDYTTSPIEDQLASLARSSKPFDAVLDCVGQQHLYLASPRFLAAPGLFVNISLDLHGASWAQTIGTFVSFMGNYVQPAWLGGVPRRFAMPPTEYRRDSIVNLIEWIGKGQVKIPIDSTHAGDEAGVKAAYERMMSNRAHGKVIVHMHEGQEM